MPSVPSRAALPRSPGQKPEPVAPAAPVVDLSAIQAAMTTMANAIAESVRIAAQAQADVAQALRDRPTIMRADIKRDANDKMLTVFITAEKK